jgi:hypothetical protein
MKKKESTTMRKVLLGAVTAIFALSAQGPKPTCVNCPATYIAASEVQAYLTRAQENRLVDQQMRAVDIGKSNIGIGVVYRSKLTTPVADSVAAVVAHGVAVEAADSVEALPEWTTSPKSVST